MIFSGKGIVYLVLAVEMDDHMDTFVFRDVKTVLCLHVLHHPYPS